MPIKIELTADTPAELRSLIEGLSSNLAPRLLTDSDRLKAIASVVPAPTGPSPKRHTFPVEAPTPVDETPAVPEDADPEPTAVELAAGEDEDETPKKRGRPKGAKNKPRDPEPEAIGAPDAKADSGLSPTDALNVSLDILTKLYSRGAPGQEGVRKLQQKFGVKSFTQLPPEKAHELLADVRALVTTLDTPKASAPDNNDPVDF